MVANSGPARRHCIDCRQPTTTTRCTACEQHRNADRDAARPQYKGKWAATSRRTLAEWRAIYGNICPGFSRPAHDTTDLTVDHRHDGSLGVLCRACNASKGQHTPIFGKRAEQAQGRG